MGRDACTVDQWDNRVGVFCEHVVHLFAKLAALVEIAGSCQLVDQSVIGWITETVDVLTLPLAGWLWLCATTIGRQILLGVCAVEGVGIHFHVCVEFLERVG
jgi:hypothetical protein